MRFSVFFILCMVIISTTACEFSLDCVVGNGIEIEETRDVDAFTAIELEGNMDLFFTPTTDTTQEVIIHADSNVIDRITTRVRNSVLEVSIGNCVLDNDIEVYITSAGITDMALSGVGTIQSVDNEIVAEDFSVSIDGAGEVDLLLNVEDFTLDINGTGEAALDGETNTFDLTVDGAGEVAAFPLVANQVDVHIDGTGDVQVRVVDDLDVYINGSGSVYYIGSPTINQEIDGTGIVRQIEVD